MKKIVFIMIFFLLVNVKALEPSVFNYSGGVDASIKQKTIVTKLNINDKNDSYIISSNTGIYIKNEDVVKHIKTNYKPVSVIVVEDINGDQIKDIVYSSNSIYGYYNVIAFSGKDESIIWSKVLTEKKYNYQSKYYYENININKIEEVGNSIVVISDYSIYVLSNEDGSLLFKYKDKDNIWDVTEVKDINNNLFEEIAISNQLGEVKLLDGKTGKILWASKLLEDLSLIRDGITYKVKRNIWQVEFYNDKLYAIGEDGTLFNIERKTGKVLDKINTYNIDKEILEQYYFTESSYQGDSISPTNKTTEFYNNFEMFFYEDKILIGAFLNAKERDKEYSLNPKVISIDINNFNNVNEVTIANLKFKNIEPLNIGDTFLLPIEIKEKNIIIGEYEYKSGKKIKDNKIYIGVNELNDNKMFIQSIKENILIEQIDTFSLLVDSKSFKLIKNINNYSYPQILKSNNDELYISYETNGIVNKIEKYDNLNDTLPIWEYNIPTDFNNTGLFSISIAKDFNKDGVNDITALINKTDEENRVIGSYFLIIDAVKGTTIKFKMLQTGSFVQNGKTINTYLIGNDLTAINDMNGDKISELVIDSMIINGSSISFYGVINSYLDVDSSKLINVGDINGDSIYDLIALEKDKATIFTSKKNGTIIEYVKTNKKHSFPNDLQNMDYALLIPDINNDGIKELLINDRDKDKKQIYNILSGKDLTSIFVINIMNSYGSMYNFLEDDINDDGYNDLCEVINGVSYNFISGKDGSSLYRIDKEEEKGNPEPIRDISTGKPDIEYDGLIVFNYDMSNKYIVSGFDITNDNKKEIYILKEEYYPQSKLVLEIYDINKKALIRSVDFYYTQEFNKGYMEDSFSSIAYYKQINEVVNGNGLFIINPPANTSIIYDAKENKILSEFDLYIMKSIKTDDNKIFGVTNENSPVSINYYNDLLVDSLKMNNTYKSPINIKLNKTLKEDLRVIKVFNQGTLLTTEYEDEFDLKLKRGNYNLVIKSIDRWGKTQNYSINISIKKFNPFIIIFLILTLAFISLLVYLSIGHKLIRNYMIRRIYG